MARYTYSCSKHGLFDIEMPMSETTRERKCPTCGYESPKYVGHFTLHYAYGGRKVFHDGPEGDGRTVREVAADWVADYKENNIPYEPAGSRWV